MKSLIFLSLLFSFSAIARVPFCHDIPILSVGVKCRVNPVLLKPTQFNLGMKAVDAKIEKLAEKYKNPRKFDKYLWKKKIVPVILGDDFKDKKRSQKTALYMIDGHHTMRALAEMNLNYPVYIEVKEDLRLLDYDNFWYSMVSRKLAYPKDRGIVKSVSKLPKTLYRLTNDPYRSLSWEIRELGCYVNLDDIPFQEFFWADFLRGKIAPNELEAAKELAISSDASFLPGYKGECSQTEE